jgi:hypothetical protein
MTERRRAAPRPGGVVRQWSAGRERPQAEGVRQQQQQDEEGEGEAGGGGQGSGSGSVGSAPRRRSSQNQSVAGPSDEGLPLADDPVFKGPFGLAVGVAEAADEEEEDEEEAAAAGGGRSRGGGGTSSGRSRQRTVKDRRSSTKAPY